MNHLIVSFDSLEALLQTFHLFLLIIEFTIKVTNLSLLALEHLLSRSKISFHLPLIAFQKLDLLLILASLPLFISDDLIIGLCIQLQLLYLSCSFFQTTLEFLLLSFKLDDLLSLFRMTGIEQLTSSLRLRAVAIRVFDVCRQSHNCEVALQVLTNELSGAIYHEEVSDFRHCQINVRIILSSIFVKKLIPSCGVQQDSPPKSFICLHYYCLREAVKHVTSELTPALIIF